jgi:hypothetical protein
MKALGFFLIFFLLLNIAGAQTIIVKGRVVDADSAAILPFCSIILNDTATFTSDLSGNFQIVLDSNAKKCNLNFKYIGFETLQVINIPMPAAVINLGDIPMVSQVNYECGLYVVCSERGEKWRKDKRATKKELRECLKLSEKERERRSLKQIIIFNGKSYHPINRIVDLK